MPGSQGPWDTPPGSQCPRGTPPHPPPGGVKGFLAVGQNDGFSGFDLFFLLPSPSPLSPNPSRALSALLARFARLLARFVLFSHLFPSMGKAFSVRTRHLRPYEITMVLPIGRAVGATPNGREALIIWRNRHSTPHREGRRCRTKCARIPEYLDKSPCTPDRDEAGGSTLVRKVLPPPAPVS